MARKRLSRTRTELLVGFAVGVVVIGLSSAAWACTTKVGQLTLTQGSTSKTNIANDPGFCGTQPTMGISTVSSFTATWRPYPTGTCIASSPAVSTATALVSNDASEDDCHDLIETPTPTKSVGTFGMTNGSGTITLGGSVWDTGGDQWFCVKNSGATYGMEMPVSLM